MAHPKKNTNSMRMFYYIGATILVGGIITTFIYFQQNPTVKDITALFDAAPPTIEVNILTPASEQAYQLDETVFVESLAISNEKLVQAELWVNDMLAEVFIGPPGGSNSLYIPFNWSPTHSGVYSISVRVQSENGQSAYAFPVFIIVNADEIIEESEEFSISSSNPAEIAYSPISGPSPEDSVAQGAEYQGSEQPSPQSPPLGPSILSSPEGCGAKILIHDLSNNEDGFSIYRSTLGSQNWVLAGQLSAQSDNDWLFFLDEGVQGVASYYVTAFNQEGSASSNIAFTSIPAQNCPDNTSVLPLTTLGLQINWSYQQSYCYTALNNGPWVRVPAEGFFDPQSVEVKIGEYLLGKPGETQVETEIVELNLECWGLNDVKLTKIWGLSKLIDLTDPESINLELEGIDAKLTIKNFDIPAFVEFSEFFTLEDDFNGFGFIKLDPKNASFLDLKFPEVDAGQMPMISAWLSYDPKLCLQHDLSPGKHTACAPMYGYNVGPKGASPQPYMLWLPNNNTCSNGYNEECMSLEKWIQFADLVSYYDLYWETASKSFMSTNFYTPITTVAKTSCGTSNRVRLVLADTRMNGSRYTGPWSSWVSTPECTTVSNSVFIEVSIENITLTSVNDGGSDSIEVIDMSGNLLNPTESIGDDLEAYGYFRAWESNFGGYYDVKRGLVRLGDTDEYCDSLTQGFCRRLLYVGSFDLTYAKLCNIPTNLANTMQDLYYYHKCPFAYSAQNNTIILEVHDGEAIALWSWLKDYDKLSLDDKFCYNPNYWTPKFTLKEWAATQDAIYQLSSYLEGTNCTVTIRLNAIGSP